MMEVRHNDEGAATITIQHVKQLIERKDRMETEMQAIVDSLQSTQVGVSGPLVDAMGFPRNDVDVNHIREMRHRLAVLRTDLKQLVQRIDTDMQQLHQSTRTTATTTATTKTKEAEDDDQNVNIAPFARVNAVAPDSPAAESGLRNGDLVLRFGSLTRTEIDTHGLKMLGEFVSHRVNQPVYILVQRTSHAGNKSERVQVKLTPRVWSGRGYLGCHLVPFTTGH